MLKNIFGFTRAAVFGVIAALVLTCVFQPSRIQGISMEPTVMNGTPILLNKASYWFASPTYGDIVLFKSTVFTDSGEGKALIKRVVGIENDEIEITDGKVYRNGKYVNEKYVTGVNPRENMKKVKIAAGKVFVLGDRRDASLDSRDDSIGQLRVSDIIGKVGFRIYPFSEKGFVK